MHVARENALEKAASGFSVITCSDSLSSAAEASLCRSGAGEDEKGKRAGGRWEVERQEVRDTKREPVQWREVLIGINMA